MVAAGDRAEIAFDPPCAEHAVACGPGLRLDRRALGDFGMQHVMRDPELAADRGDELRFGRGFAAQAVVDCRRLDLPRASSSGEQQQREAVRPARHRDSDSRFGCDQQVEIRCEPCEGVGMGGE